MFAKIFRNPKIELFDAMTAKDVKGWDSLNHINLILATEKLFKIKFTTKEIQTLPNVGSFIELIEKKLS
ncbi:MAG TPA: acyl carrier protein [Leptospiraceae bacterium]|nr:acyl carrier protein [Leptospiraceae bacterium]